MGDSGMIDALIAVSDATKTAIADAKTSIREKRETKTPLTATEEKVMKVFKELNRIQSGWKGGQLDGKEWAVYDLLLEPDELEKLADNLGAGVRIIGAWNRDGTQYGQRLSYDEDGKEVIEGEPVYKLPTKAQLLKFMPDEIDDPNLGSVKPATVLKQVHKFFGWADRRWT